MTILTPTEKRFIDTILHQPKNIRVMSIDLWRLKNGKGGMVELSVSYEKKDKLLSVGEISLPWVKAHVIESLVRKNILVLTNEPTVMYHPSTDYKRLLCIYKWGSLAAKLVKKTVTTHPMQ